MALQSLGVRSDRANLSDHVKHDVFSGAGEGMLLFKNYAFSDVEEFVSQSGDRLSIFLSTVAGGDDVGIDVRDESDAKLGCSRNSAKRLKVDHVLSLL